MLLLPTVRLVVVHMAVPLLNGTVASIVEPFRNVTVPVGVPEPLAGVTVAVREMD